MAKPNYNYIKITHTGEDYIFVKKGNKSFEITGDAIEIIRCLINKINK